MPEINSMTLLAQIVNWMILAALIGAAFLVGRDARKMGKSWTATLGWAALTFFVFPIGLGLYFLVGRKSRAL